MTERRVWDRKEQILALHLYFTLPFGKLHQHNHEVIKVANAISRSPSAVAMKACNFASLDPALLQKGLGNVSANDRQLWMEFMKNSEEIASESEKAFEDLNNDKFKEPSGMVLPKGPTEVKRTVKIRRVQSFFRNSLLVSYENKCAISGLSINNLLIASHIIPWSADETRRADPTNGILLNALYDRAFDDGLISIDNQLRVILSDKLKESIKNDLNAANYFNIEGKKIIEPVRFLPDPDALEYHRVNRFNR